MNKIEIAIFSFLFGMAVINEIKTKNIQGRLIDWLEKKSEEINARKKQ